MSRITDKNNLQGDPGKEFLFRFLVPHRRNRHYIRLSSPGIGGCLVLWSLFWRWCFGTTAADRIAKIRRLAIRIPPDSASGSGGVGG